MEKATFDLQEMHRDLWNIGMDDCPFQGGYLTTELETRNGQQCEILECYGFGATATVKVQWLSDGIIENISDFGLIRE